MPDLPNVSASPSAVTQQAQAANADSAAASQTGARPSVRFAEGVKEAAPPAPRAQTNQLPVMTRPVTMVDFKRLELDVEKKGAAAKRTSGLIKDGLSYLFSALSVGASSGAAALAQPLFRVALNMVDRGASAFRNGSSGLIGRLAGGFTAAFQSLAKDVGAVFTQLKQFAAAPGSETKRLLFGAAEAPKTWGHVGALLGGLIGGLSGGPLMAGVGFVVGRYVGQAAGRVLSHAAGNSGLTVMETARQALFAGYAPLTDKEAEQKLQEIHEKLPAVSEAVAKLSPGETLTDPAMITQRNRVLSLVNALEQNYDGQAINEYVDLGYEDKPMEERPVKSLIPLSGVYASVRDQLSYTVKMPTTTVQIEQESPPASATATAAPAPQAASASEVPKPHQSNETGGASAQGDSESKTHKAA